MAGFTTAVATIAAAALAAGTTVYSTEQQARQARLSRDQQKGAIAEQKRTILAREEEEKNISKVESDKAKKQARAASAGGRQDTILTSPLGVVGSAPTQSKSILGA
jgi:type IV secretory pathway VirJ component